MAVPLRRGAHGFLTLFLVFAAVGCASSVETKQEEEEGRAEAAGESIDKYERTFNPAEYNPSVETVVQLAKGDTAGKGNSAKPTDALPAEITSGFRIQVLSTTEIDSANAVKNELSTLPESVGIYVIYDSPYYKVRVGDFLSRPETNQLLKALMNRGYDEAWIVADRVLKNPPPRKPTPPAVKEPE